MSEKLDRILHPENYLPLRALPPGLSVVRTAKYEGEPVIAQALPSPWLNVEYTDYHRGRWVYVLPFKAETIQRHGKKHTVDVVSRRAWRLCERAMRDHPPEKLYAVEPKDRGIIDYHMDWFIRGWIGIFAQFDIWATRDVALNQAA